MNLDYSDFHHCVQGRASCLRQNTPLLWFVCCYRIVKELLLFIEQGFRRVHSRKGFTEIHRICTNCSNFASRAFAWLYGNSSDRTFAGKTSAFGMVRVRMTIAGLTALSTSRQRAIERNGILWPNHGKTCWFWPRPPTPRHLENWQPVVSLWSIPRGKCRFFGSDPPLWSAVVLSRPAPAGAG